MATACTLLFAIAALTALPFAAHAQDATAADETQRTEAGVIAVDNHWSLAEMTGDSAWLDQMLLPEYRSVGHDGKAHSKAMIVAGAAKRKGTSLDQAEQKFAAYRKEHPYGTAVVVRGDMAVISFYDPTLGPQKGVTSSDVFLYVDGHWHALYSQHTDVHA
ncbi:MAG: nuclear transport factor 2 family protein [Dyella sp.]|uniref:nuclear transport factor 2 family protein n=1 Tax=Dyella sp. TaxID=1869338 RepID=UPI003F81E36F